jgi:hypothetical protein
MRILDKNNNPNINNGYNVPEGYFDELPKKIMSNITTIVNLERKVIKSNFKKYVFATAASLIFLVATTVFIYQNKTNSGSDFDIESYLMGWTDSEHYIIENFEEVSLDTFFIDYNIDPNYLEDYLVNTIQDNEYLIDH